MKTNLLLILSVLVLAACPPQPRPTKLDASTGQLCASDPKVTSTDLCDDGTGHPKFESHGWACASCPAVDAPCVTIDFIWCVASCSDPSCTQQVP